MNDCGKEGKQKQTKKNNFFFFAVKFVIFNFQFLNRLLQGQQFA